MIDELASAGLWIGMRVFVAVILFEILAVPLPWQAAPMSTTIRLLLVAAVPGSIELVTLGMWLLFEQ